MSQIDLNDAILNNEKEYDQLLAVIEANQDNLNLLIAVCDDLNYREEIIANYEKELESDIHRYRITLARGEPSLRAALAELVAKDEYLQTKDKAIITVIGAEKLHFLKLGSERSEQDIFFGYLQWTREALRQFPYSIVLWVTQQIEINLSKKAPDFWSWRKGVFRFTSHKQLGIPLEEIATFSLDIENRELLQAIENNQHFLPLEDLQALVKETEETKGNQNANLIILYQRIGQIYKTRVEQGKAQNYQQEQEKAIEYFLKALNLQQKLARENGLADTVSNLASLYESQGEYEKAKPLYEQALSLKKKAFGEGDAEVATSLNDLAGLYHIKGEYHQAIDLYLQALAIQESLFNNDDPAIANTLNYLAGTYHAQGNYQEAEKLYQSALERQENVSQNQQSQVTNLKSNLALLYYGQERYSEAESLFQEVLKIKQNILGNDHPDIATLQNNLALIYLAEGKEEEAQASFQEALKLRRKILGHNHPEIAISLNNLAGLYKHQKDYNAAYPLYQEALKISEEKMGAEHPITIKIKNSLEQLADLI